MVLERGKPLPLDPTSGLFHPHRLSNYPALNPFIKPAGMKMD
jgi:hypothetical protein